MIETKDSAFKKQSPALVEKYMDVAIFFRPASLDFSATLPSNRSIVSPSLSGAKRQIDNYASKQITPFFAWDPTACKPTRVRVLDVTEGKHERVVFLYKTHDGHMRYRASLWKDGPGVEARVKRYLNLTKQEERDAKKLKESYRTKRMKVLKGLEELHPLLVRSQALSKARAAKAGKK